MFGHQILGDSIHFMKIRLAPEGFHDSQDVVTNTKLSHLLFTAHCSSDRRRVPDYRWYGAKKLMGLYMSMMNDECDFSSGTDLVEGRVRACFYAVAIQRQSIRRTMLILQRTFSSTSCAQGFCTPQGMLVSRERRR